jgi:hypothetical protein
MWMGIIGTAVVVFLLVSPNMKAAEILKELGAFQTGAIEALQGRSNPNTRG